MILLTLRSSNDSTFNSGPVTAETLLPGQTFCSCLIPLQRPERLFLVQNHMALLLSLSMLPYLMGKQLTLEWIILCLMFPPVVNEKT